MSNTDRLRGRLVAGDFAGLFIGEMGWDHPRSTDPVHLAENDLTAIAVADKKGVTAFRVACPGGLPLRAGQDRLVRELRRVSRDQLVVFTAPDEYLWLWPEQRPSGVGYRLVGHTHPFDAPTEAISGVRHASDRSWYASLILNRLMFCYFVQNKGFLDGDRCYLRSRLTRAMDRGGPDTFFKSFLLPFFHHGLGDRGHAYGDDDTATMVGFVPFVNGGIFERHRLETDYDPDIPDSAFLELFDFFDGWRWHLDERPSEDANEINPDVLGYIFEQYINQKDYGAYYTKPDVTGYMATSAILPALADRFVAAGLDDPATLLAGSRADYIHDILGHGADKDAPTPPPADRGRGNGTAATLPNTSSCRLRATTWHCPGNAGATWCTAASDTPACSTCCRTASASGALKTICLRNLYGVDIMAEAPEVAKLRLFLKLAAQIDRVEDLEPLPDLDFNIKCGNLLVGVRDKDDAAERIAVAKSDGQLSLASVGRLDGIGLVAAEMADAYDSFVETQATHDHRGVAAAKRALLERSESLRADSDDLLHGLREETAPLDQWVASHQPFHWFIEFPSIWRNGGFDVIISNPPYIKAKNVKGYRRVGYATAKCPDLYAVCIERASTLLNNNGRFAMIVMHSLCFSRDFQDLRASVRTLLPQVWISSFARRPDSLFDKTTALYQIGVYVNEPPTVDPITREPASTSSARTGWMYFETEAERDIALLALAGRWGYLWWLTYS